MAQPDFCQFRSKQHIKYYKKAIKIKPRQERKPCCMKRQFMKRKKYLKIKEKEKNLAINKKCHNFILKNVCTNVNENKVKSYENIYIHIHII